MSALQRQQLVSSFMLYAKKGKKLSTLVDFKLEMHLFLESVHSTTFISAQHFKVKFWGAHCLNSTKHQFPTINKNFLH